MHFLHPIHVSGSILLTFMCSLSTWSAPVGQTVTHWGYRHCLHTAISMSPGYMPKGSSRIRILAWDRFGFPSWASEHANMQLEQHVHFFESTRRYPFDSGMAWSGEEDFFL